MVIKKREKVENGIAGTFLLIITILMMGIVTHAEELKVNTLYEILEDTNVYEEASETSNVISQLQKGTPIICQEEPANGWTKVLYKEVEGYVPVSTIQKYDNTEEISEEFALVGEENDMRFRRMENYINQKKQESIWGGVIIALVVAIFAVGIISSIKKKKSEGNEKNR